MNCPKCGSELDTGFNCPKCGYRLHGTELTKEQKLWWLVEDDCYFKKWYYEKYYILFHGSFYSGDTLTEAVEQAYNKAREAQNERD